MKGSEKELLTRAGSLAGKEVLDLGCGLGRLSTLAAKRGAQVTAIDMSAECVLNTRSLAEKQKVQNQVTAHRMDAHDIPDLDKTFDLVIGKFILHEIEPFSDFAKRLYGVLHPGGKGIFYENNARNRLLCFARRMLVGKLGIVKHGHEDEHPLEPSEIQDLKRTFSWVHVRYPNFVFLRLMNTYIFEQRKEYVGITDTLKWADEWLEDSSLPIHKFSYHQIVEFGR